MSRDVWPKGSRGSVSAPRCPRYKPPGMRAWASQSLCSIPARIKSHRHPRKPSGKCWSFTICHTFRYTTQRNARSTTQAPSKKPRCRWFVAELTALARARETGSRKNSARRAQLVGDLRAEGPRGTVPPAPGAVRDPAQKDPEAGGRTQAGRGSAVPNFVNDHDETAPRSAICS